MPCVREPTLLTRACRAPLRTAPRRAAFSLHLRQNLLLPCVREPTLLTRADRCSFNATAFSGIIARTGFSQAAARLPIPDQRIRSKTNLIINNTVLGIYTSKQKMPYLYFYIRFVAIFAIQQIR
jgi:hypothetical protein